ncbi:ATP-dependent zinc metalloprotease FtsH [Wenyingzhuangia sp. IMCC45574]
MKNENKNQQQKPNGMKSKFNSYWIYAAIIALIISFNIFDSSSSSSDISKNKFQEFLRNNSIEQITIVNNDFAEIYLTEEAQKKLTPKDAEESLPWLPSKPKLTYNFGSLENFENYLTKSTKEYGLSLDVINEPRTNLFDSLLGFLPFIIILGLWIFFMRRMSGGGGAGGGGGQIFSIGKSKAKLFDENQKIKISFKDVAGLEGAKEEVQEIVDFLKSPQKYTNLGGKIPKGALLVGPPGTGKTLLAKAVAGEAGVPFFSLSGSDFVEMFVGVGASRVRDLFKQAAQKSPSIIFIDEIDAIGRARGKNNMTGGNDERENTLNQLLTEMDGFGTDTNVIVIAATNRADVLDKALMRAGRFDRQIYVDLPDINERQAIFKVHLKPLKLSDGVKVDFLSQQTPGFSGADIANLCNEAALMAARKGKQEIENQDFLDSVDRIVGGLEKKNKIISKLEKETIAFHEAGHATASWFLKYADPLVKVTIVPRGQSLGAAWYLPEESSLTKRQKFLDEICATMAGRAAEKIIFDEISSGAYGDLQMVTRKAKAMVSVYGMSDKVGNITFYDPQTDNGFTKPYSEATAELIDKEINQIIEAQYQRAIDILTENKENLTKLAQRLLEKEVIFKDDLVKIFGERPFKEERIIAPRVEEKQTEEQSDAEVTQ